MTEVPSSIDDLGVSTRLRNCLVNDGYQDISRILAASPADLLRTPGLGPACLKELVTVLAEHGLALNGPDGRDSFEHKVVTMLLRIEAKLDQLIG